MIKQQDQNNGPLSTINGNYSTSSKLNNNDEENNCLTTLQTTIGGLQKQTRVAERLSEVQRKIAIPTNITIDTAASDAVSPTAAPLSSSSDGDMAAGAEESNETNKHADLLEGMAKFNTMRGALRDAIALAQKYKVLALEAEKTKFELANSLSKLSIDSPLYNVVGDEANKDSFLSRQKQRLTLSMRQQVDFQSAVVDYLIEWETIVSTQVDGLYAQLVQQRKLIQKCHRRFQNKRRSTVVLAALGASSSSSSRPPRHQTHLEQATATHGTMARRLAVVLDEIVTRAWRDLFPLINHVLRLDMVQHQQRSRTVIEYFKNDLLQLEDSFDRGCGSIVTSTVFSLTDDDDDDDHEAADITLSDSDDSLFGL